MPLLSLFSEVWPYIVPFLSSMLALGTGYWLATLARRRAEVTKVGAETAAQKKEWREKILLADATNAEAIKKEHAERIYWQLENAADWERVVGILKEFGEVQRQLAVVAATSQHHGAEIHRLNAGLDSINKHLNDFVLRHVRQTSA